MTETEVGGYAGGAAEVPAATTGLRDDVTMPCRRGG